MNIKRGSSLAMANHTSDQPSLNASRNDSSLPDLINSVKFDDIGASFMSNFISDQEHILRVAYLVVLSIATGLGNLLVLVAVLKFPSLRRHTNAMLGSLALSDFLVGTVTVPLYTAWTTRPGIFDRSAFMCGLVLLSCLLVVTASQVSLLMLSVEQYLAVCHPFRHRNLLIGCPRLHSFGVGFAWASSFLTAAVSLLAYDKKPSVACNYYSVFDENFLFVASIFGVFFPFALIIYFNVRVLCVVKKNEKRMTFAFRGDDHCPILRKKGRVERGSVSFTSSRTDPSGYDPTHRLSIYKGTDNIVGLLEITDKNDQRSDDERTPSKMSGNKSCVEESRSKLNAIFQDKEHDVHTNAEDSHPFYGGSTGYLHDIQSCTRLQGERKSVSEQIVKDVTTANGAELRTSLSDHNLNLHGDSDLTVVKKIAGVANIQDLDRNDENHKDLSALDCQSRKSQNLASGSQKRNGTDSIDTLSPPRRWSITLDGRNSHDSFQPSRMNCRHSLSALSSVSRFNQNTDLETALYLQREESQISPSSTDGNTTPLKRLRKNAHFLHIGVSKSKTMDNGFQTAHSLSTSDILFTPSEQKLDHKSIRSFQDISDTYVSSEKDFAPLCDIRGNDETTAEGLFKNDAPKTNNLSLDCFTATDGQHCNCCSNQKNNIPRANILRCRSIGHIESDLSDTYTLMNVLEKVGSGELHSIRDQRIPDTFGPNSPLLNKRQKDRSFNDITVYIDDYDAEMSADSGISVTNSPVTINTDGDGKISDDTVFIELKRTSLDGDIQEQEEEEEEARAGKTRGQTIGCLPFLSVRESFRKFRVRRASRSLSFSSVGVSRKVRWMVALVCATFILAWFPFFAVILANTFCDSCTLTYFLNAAIMVAFSKSMANPVVYALCHVAFRRAYGKVFKALGFKPCC